MYDADESWRSLMGEACMPKRACFQRGGLGMRIAICDDEPQYRELLHERILRDSFANDYEAEVAEYGSGEELAEAVREGASADVYFLDVQMEEGTDDGIRAARELRRCGEKGLIVYVTSYIDYVQTGYEVRAFRYLLKSQIPEKLSQVLADIRQELSDGRYFFQAGGARVSVERKRILYLESDRRMLCLTAEDARYSFYGSLDEAERALGEQFLRCHKSFLVNMGQIQRYSAGEIVLRGEIAVPVSRSYAKEVKRRLMLGLV